MKSFGLVLTVKVDGVTLCVRVWIEILIPRANIPRSRVTLCVRVWIEMPLNSCQ